ncbi:MAG: fibronectin type III-like domain-contianing protein, partial [Cytophagales bacterium]|nr:fibronectin type III-like domain-contianing protein [Cytophagales bacterium]
QILELGPGASEAVVFEITPGLLAQVNMAGETVTEPGDYAVYIGGVSPVQVSKDRLGKPALVKASFNVN